MTAGVLLTPDRGAANVVDAAVAQARAAYQAGVRQVWLGQQLDYDATVLAAVIGSSVTGLAVGTSVLPINPRHPLIVAAAAQTAQAATGGRFSLGLGLGVPMLEQMTFDISATGTIARLREFLTVLRALNDDRTVEFRGGQYTAVETPFMPVALAGTTPFPVYVAAMGPKALQATGELADGTLTALAGPRTIGQFIVPTIARAAADAGRPGPRVIAMVSVAVTSGTDTDTDTARETAAASMGMYDLVPSYQKVMAREEVAKAADLAVIGTAEAVTGQLKSYLAAGATEIAIVPLQAGAEDLRRVWDVTAAL
ncbi:LLM class F420-dependent oxidoreductase [soil metagenome]